MFVDQVIYESVIDDASLLTPHQRARLPYLIMGELLSRLSPTASVCICPSDIMDVLI